MTAALEPPFIARSVRVDPATAEQDKLPRGGINWELIHGAPIWARHLRGGTPTDLPFEPSQSTPRWMPGKYVWGGYAVAHFGHFVAEQSTRLLRSDLESEDSRLLLVLPPKLHLTGPPAWLVDVLNWYRFPVDRVVFVTDHPVVVEELHIFPQEEHLTSRPSGAYLDLLDQHVDSRLPLGHGSIPLTYVSRAGLQGGGLGGELYLENALKNSGALIVRPEELPVDQQLDIYSRSDALIFAEGSAVHGRQLLGRIDQRIAIVVRRKGTKFAGRMMQPRTRELVYLDAIDCSVHFSFDPRNGMPKRWEAFPLSIGAQIVAEFSRIGVDLAPSWDEKAFDKQRDSDLDTWATRISRANSGTDLEARIRLMQGSLYGVGLDRLAPRLAEIARSASANSSQARH